MNLDILKSNLPYLIAGAIVAVAGVVVLEQFSRASSYMHYLRIPLLAALVLFTLPIMASHSLSNVQNNWFIVNTPCKLAFIIVVVVWVGLGIAIAAQVLLLNIPCRYFGECSPVITKGSIWPYGLALILAIPTSYLTYQSSGPESMQMTEGQRRTGAGCGIFCAVSQLFLVYLFNKHPVLLDIRQNLGLAFSYLPGSTKGYLFNDEVAPGHAETLWFILLAAVLYLGYSHIFRPILVKHQTPIIKALVSLLIFTLLFSFLTFWLDNFGIPVVMLSIAWIMTVYCFWGVEHHYELTLVSDHFINNQENSKLTQ